MRATLNHAITLHLAGQTREAITSYENILAADPGSAGARHGLAVLLLQSQQPNDALKHLEKLVAVGTDDADVFNTLGIAHQQLDDEVQALAPFRIAIELDPFHSKALANLGVCLHKKEDYDQAESAFQRAVDADPKNAETYYNYGQTLRALNKLGDAERATRWVLSISPAHILARVDLGITLTAQGRLVEAEECYRRAIKLNPGTVEAHNLLAHILLNSGRLEEGWAEFEWRWHTPKFAAAQSFHTLPKWHGERLESGSLLVWAEQGVGDQVMYASMLNDIPYAKPNITLACTPNLVSLFSRSFPDTKVVSMLDLKSDPELLRNVVAQVPIGSLGQFVRLDISAFPKRSSFLVAGQGQTRKFRDTYKSDAGDRPLIGLSWSSNNKLTGEAQSLGLASWAPTLDGKAATFIDLQYGDTSEDLARAKDAGLSVFSDPEIDQLTDFDAFAAQVAAMDLVITISNTTAHIAGALGVPCWVLMASGPGQNWYWFLDPRDSPWYPSIRLFRQAKPGDWSGVLNAVKEALTEQLTHVPYIKS